MDFIVGLIESASDFVGDHLEFVALAITVTMLIIFGSNLNSFVTKKIARFNRFVRILLFSLVCLFVYGLLLQSCNELWILFLEQFNDKFLAPFVVILFIILGSLVEKNNK